MRATLSKFGPWTFVTRYSSTKLHLIFAFEMFTILHRRHIIASSRKMLQDSQRFPGFILFFGMIIGQAFHIDPKNNCDCKVMVSKNLVTQYIECSYTGTIENAYCASQYIAAGGENISAVKLWRSDIELFPKDFILPDNVKTISFWKCKMDGIENPLFQSICPSLLSIHFNLCEMKNKAIPAEVFGKCKNLQEIEFYKLGIEAVSKNAFSGLNNLRSLYLYGNALKSFEGFENIANLEELHLGSNKISTVSKNAFQGLEKLTDLHLSNNQLTKLEARIIQGLESLIYLDLSANRLSTLEEGIFDPFKNNKDVLIQLYGKV